MSFTFPKHSTIVFISLEMVIYDSLLFISLISLASVYDKFQPDSW